MNSPPSDHDEEKAIARLIDTAGPRKPPSDERYARVQANVHAHFHRDTPPTRQRPDWRWAVGLAAALVLSLGVLLKTPDTPAPPIAQVLAQRGSVTLPNYLAAGSVLRTGHEGQLSVRLASGHELRVQPDSVVRLASAARLDLESGTLYLDSGTDAVGHAVAVHTQWGLATDIGTRFDVSVRDGRLDVAVRDGIVEVRDVAGADPTTPVRLQGGQGVQVGASGQVTRFDVAPWDARWRWTRALAEFGQKRAPGRDYLNWLCREYGLTLVLDDPTIAADLRQPVSGLGALPDADPQVAFADALATLGLEHRLGDDGTVHVSRAR